MTKTLARGLFLSACCLLALPAPAQRIKWSSIERVMQRFDEISPQPPPVEVVEVGTLDASTGTFTWGPAIRRKKSDAKSGIFAPVIDKVKLPPMVVDFAPQLQITGIAARLQPDIGAAHPLPRPATAGDPRNTELPKATIGGPYTGHSLNQWRYQALVRSGTTSLVFRVVNRPAGAPVAVSSCKRDAAADADFVDILVPPRVMVDFTVSCGGKGFTDRLWFDRPPVLGYFMLEALPVTVVYEPPGSGSSQTYTVIDQVGSTLRSFSSGGAADSAPVTTNFSMTHDFIEVVGQAGAVVANFYPAVGAAMQGGSAVLLAAIGDQEVETEVTTTVTEEHTLSIQVKETNAVTTTARLGPGRGDVIWFLQQPVFAWLAFQDEATMNVYVTVSLLGYRRPFRVSAEDLRLGTFAEPGREMQNLLLLHDVLTPEYAKAHAGKRIGHLDQRIGSLTGRRLVEAEPFEQAFAGSSVLYEFERTLTSEDVVARTTTQTTTTTSSGGFLSYVCPNLPQSGSSTVSMSQGTSAGSRKDHTVRASVTLAAAVGEGHVVQCWYDRLSGTFAYKEVPLGASANAMTGTASNEDGSPLAKQPVILRTAEGIAVRGITDEKGRFDIRSELLKAGQQMLEVKGQRFPVAYEPGKTKDQDVRLGKGGPLRAEPINDRRKPAEPYAIGPGEGLRGRMGRLVVRFPEAAPAKSTHVGVFDAGDAGKEQQIDSKYGSVSLDLLAGSYVITIGSQRVAVPIERGRQTTVHVGTLRTHAAPGTSIAILAATGDQVLYSGYGKFEWGLPAGEYRVRVHGRTEPATVTAGQVTEF